MLSVNSLAVPIILDESDTYRVGGTRISLDLVIKAFQDGDTAEEIIQKYPSLHLGDIYTVLAWYLGNQREIDEYIDRQTQQYKETRSIVKERCNQHGIRRRLMSRRIS